MDYVGEGKDLKHWPNVLQNTASRVANFNIDEDGDKDGGDKDP